MTVELWYGKKPTNPGEQNVLIELYDFLKSRREYYVLMCVFHSGVGNETDLVILKQDAIFMVELKHYWDRVEGGKDGKWKYVREDGKEGSFDNPYQQVRQCSFDWQKWYQDHQDELEQVSGQQRPPELYRPLEYVVFYPDLHPDSDIQIGDHPVQAMGLGKFRTALLIRSLTGLKFSRQEMQSIPRLQKLTQWHIDPPKDGYKTVKLEGDIQPPVVRMLVPRNPDPAIRVFHITSGLVTIGRDLKYDISINHDSISRKHAEISRGDNHWVVKDLNSLNGTFVSYNGDPEMVRRVPANESNALKNGSIVCFGEISYTVILDE